MCGIQREAKKMTNVCTYLPLFQLLSEIDFLAYSLIQLAVGLHQLHSCFGKRNLKIKIILVIKYLILVSKSVVVERSDRLWNCNKSIRTSTLLDENVGLSGQSAWTISKRREFKSRYVQIFK